MEKLKEIFNLLISKGFKQDGTVFTIEKEVNRGQVIINGKVIDNTEKITLKIEYVGESCWMNADESNPVPLYGFKVNDRDEMWVQDKDMIIDFVG